MISFMRLRKFDCDKTKNLLPLCAEVYLGNQHCMGWLPLYFNTLTLLLTDSLDNGSSSDVNVDALN